MNVVSPAVIMAQVTAAGGDLAILRAAGIPLAYTLLERGPLSERAHEHTRSRWERHHDCSGCREAARAYYRARAAA